ncbi:MAG: phosphoribosylformylglycinamidine synthase subunit PurS, partial [bacterium]|nr:phosphoribosylformylglycinamidine synthase subunit PurS [bacterium]
MKIQVWILPKKAVLDPAGKTVKGALHQMGHTDVAAVYIGRYLEIEVSDSLSPEMWRERIDQACKSVIANL